MTPALAGAGLVLIAVAAGLRASFIRMRRQRMLLWSLAAALGEMESAIRWQQMPMPQLLEMLTARADCGVWFDRVAKYVESGITLQSAWDNTFSDLPDKQTASVLRRVVLGGDCRRLTGALGRAREELEAIYEQRCREDARRFRTCAAISLCSAGLLIILLI